MPRVVDRSEKKEKILEAAIRLFAKQGLANTRMVAIAETAGIGKGTIYEYFRSKEELFLAAFNAYIFKTESHIAHRLRRIVDPVEKLRAYFTGWIDILESDFIEFADIMLDFWSEGLRRNEEDTHFDLIGMYKKYRTQIIDILEEGIEQKKFKVVNTTITASIIIGTIDGLLIQWIMDRDLYRVREALEQLSDILIHGLTEDDSATSFYRPNSRLKGPIE